MNNQNKIQRFFINASNIHKGGGSILIKEILSALPSQIRTYVLCDSRLIINKEEYKNVKFKEIKPNIFARLNGDLWIYRNSGKNDFLLCFGNLPPIFKSRSFVILFLQNRFLIDDIRFINYLNLFGRIRIYSERIISWSFKFTSLSILSS